MAMTEDSGFSSVTVLRQESKVNENEETVQFIEVFRSEPAPKEIILGAKLIEKAYPAGTLVNVGVGPELPENPYEGQVWIKI